MFGFSNKNKVDPTVLEIYKIAVNGVDKTSDRRWTTNNLFFTLNWAIFAYLWTGDKLWDSGFIVALFWVVVSMAWFMQLRGYKLLNKAKFAVIDEIEKKFPVGLFSSEWVEMAKLRKDSFFFKGHRSLTSYEWYLPATFWVAYMWIAIFMTKTQIVYFFHWVAKLF